MAIVFQCHQCQRRISVAETKAGMRGACPTCKTKLTVPAAASTADPLASKLTAQGKAPHAPTPAAAATPPEEPASPTTAVAADAGAEAAPLPQNTPPANVPAARPEVQQKILQAFNGQVERLKPPFTYKLGVGACAAVMVLLPVVYVALIGALVWLLYLHATHNVGMLGLVRGRAVIVVFMLYAAPLVAGGIMVLFMIKPLFAPPAHRGRERSLTEKGEPLLLAFIYRICDIVGAPHPVRVNIDYSVNASASFRRGVFSFLSNDLVLTIGMPLAAGLTLRQFAGVLAHEMGHFSQGTGMRVSYVTRRINQWLERVVYERDQWDVVLEESSESADIRIAWILWLARMGVTLSRLILWVLMMIGHLVSGFLLRQMEYDADRYAVRVAGSKTFAGLNEQVRLLSLAEQKSLHDLMEYYGRRRLIDNWIELLMSNLEDMPPKLLEAERKRAAEQKTSLLSTHPADRDRIASAEAENAAGVFRLDGKCPVLFCHYEAILKNITWDLHCALLGPGFSPAEMEPLAEINATSRYAEANHRPPIDETPIPLD